MKRRIAIAILLVGVALVWSWLSAPRSRVDFGEWRAVVIHSDDWGLEGWFPHGVSDSLRAVLSADVPPWQSAYLSSTLETADEVRELAEWLAAFRDMDGLPCVIQANTILAGPSVRAQGDGGRWPVHASGHGDDYRRPALDLAVDEAIASGVWWPELHGLTHYDLYRYAEARRAGDPLAVAAAREGVFAYEGYRREAELDRPDPERAREVIGEAVERFVARFGRVPASVIAADYRWGDEDERAWAEQGLRIVQAKREQVDRSLEPHTRLGRLRKWWKRFWFDRSSPLVRIERTVDLEPYGNAAADAPQGAIPAHAAIEEAFDRGEVGVLSIHRVQLVSTDPEIARAGRAHLARVIRRLEESGGVRFLVDDEVDQLRREGWSVLQRGEVTVFRNWTAHERLLTSPAGEERLVPARSSVVSGNFPRAREEFRN